VHEALAGRCGYSDLKSAISVYKSSPLERKTGFADSRTTITVFDVKLPRRRLYRQVNSAYLSVSDSAILHQLRFNEDYFLFADKTLRSSAEVSDIQQICRTVEYNCARIPSNGVVHSSFSSWHNWVPKAWMHTRAMSPLQLWILATSLATSGTELDACSLAHWEFFRAFGGGQAAGPELSDQAASLSR
jgi:hypothetical protein